MHSLGVHTPPSELSTVVDLRCSRRTISKFDDCRCNPAEECAPAALDNESAAIVPTTIQALIRR